jgi:hypothetical protein
MMEAVAMRLGWGGILVCAGLACMGAAEEPVPQDLQDKTEAALSPHFINPQTNIWRFDGLRPFLGPDKVVCGWVNYQTAGQHYFGFHQFYAIIHEGKVQMAQLWDIREDTSGAMAAKMKVLCD